MLNTYATLRLLGLGRVECWKLSFSFGEYCSFHLVSRGGRGWQLLCRSRSERCVGGDAVKRFPSAVFKQAADAASMHSVALRSFGNCFKLRRNCFVDIIANTVFCRFSIDICKKHSPEFLKMKWANPLRVSEWSVSGQKRMILLTLL
jgi:hypothetical protein